MRAQFGREWLEEEYGRKHRSLKDMGRECNVSRETIRFALKEFGIEYVAPRKRIDIKKVRELVERRQKSFRAAARELGTTHHTIKRICQENFILYRDATEEEKRLCRNARLREKYRADPEYRKKLLAYQKEWCQNNRDRRNAYLRAWREKNPDEAAKWQRNNKEKVYAYQKKWKAAKRRAQKPKRTGLKMKDTYPVCITSDNLL